MRHSGPVNAVTATPDGTQIISASNDTTIRVWDRTTEQLVHELSGHSTPVLAVAITPDGTQIISASSGGTIRRWDRTTGWEIGEPLAGHRGGVSAVAVTPDGEQIVAGYSDGKLIIWNRTTGEQIGEPLTGHTGAISAVAVTMDGEIISAAYDDTIRLWERTIRRSSRLHDGTQVTAPTALAISPDGDEIASAHTDGTIFWWRSPGGLMGARTSVPRVDGIAYTPDGSRIVLAGSDGIVHMMDRATRQLLADRLIGHAGPVRAVAVTPDGAQIVSGGDDGTVRVWDLPGTGVLRGHEGAVHALAVHGDLIASGSKDGTVRIWDRTTGRPVHRPLTEHTGSVNTVTFTPDGLLVSGCNDHYLRIWEGFAGEPPIEIETGHTGGLRALAADDNLIVSAGWDSVIRTWDRSTNELSAEISTAHAGGIRALALTPDGTQIISAGVDGAVSIWDRNTGDLVRILFEGTGPVNALASSLDGKQIISAGADGNVRTWDRHTGELVAENAQPGEVWALAVNADGGRIVVGGEDGVVRVWGPGTAALTGHAGPVHAVALVEEQIISGGADGTVRIWDQPVALRGMRLAEVVSDLESAEDRLDITGDVWTIAAMVAALSTVPPLSVALLGDWGAGKSSFMRQVRDRVVVLARSGGSAFAANVRQVRFNAWHYSDDHLWVGLVEHLFRELARPAAERTAEKITDLEVTLSSRKAERERLETDLRAVDRVDTRRGWLGKLWLPLRSARVFRAAVVGVWREFRSSWWRILVLLGVIGAGVTAVVLGAGWLGGVVAAVAALVGPVVSGWRRLGEFTEQARRELLERKSEVDTEISVVEEKLSRLDPKRRLHVLLAEISTAERYESYRGLTGRIHHDLRRLSDDLAAARRQWEDGGSVGSPPLQRIVLYVDDLDRCAPRRVVDVLQAVNLLLTMELFVVVVAVDPRWLLRSLEKHHEGLFEDNAVAYLDKIFHIPVALRPMGEHAANYLRSLLPPEEEPVRPALPQARSAPVPEVQPRPEEVPRRQQVPQHAVPPQRLPVATHTPEGLRLRAQEREFLGRLAPLLGTPRAIKKLVNLYRLLRLGIPERNLGEFIGDERGGPYQAAALLLATLVGEPHEARQLLEELANVVPGQDIAEAVNHPIGKFIVELRKDMPVHGDTATYRRWAKTVARYGFETYDLFSG